MTMSITTTIATALFATQLMQAPPPAPTSGASITQQRAAVAKSERLMAEALKRPGILSEYLYMREARQRDPDVAFRLIFNQYLSWFQTWVGDYAGSRTTFSIAQPPEKGDSAAPMDTGYKQTPALDAIVALAKDRQAIFLNENHNLALTRTLTVQLLSKLREAGYDTFAAETLYHDDENLAKRGYPNADTGFYTQEPIYAEMVRTALKLGYRVVAYESESMATGDAREREQARNLYQRVYDKQHPKARLVVNAGFTHIQKTGKYFDGAAMAQHFSTLSGIEPISVEQTVMIPHDIITGDHPVYRRIAQEVQFDTPIVFRNDAGALWSLRPQAFDVSVVFPAEVYRRGRPTWATIGDLRVPYAITGDLCKQTYPCLVEARYADEGEDAIPADRLVFELNSNMGDAKDRVRTSSDPVPASDFYLRPGRYRIVARDASNRQLGSTVNTVGGSP